MRLSYRPRVPYEEEQAVLDRILEKRKHTRDLAHAFTSRSRGWRESPEGDTRREDRGASG